MHTFEPHSASVEPPGNGRIEQRVKRLLRDRRESLAVAHFQDRLDVGGDLYDALALPTGRISSPLTVAPFNACIRRRMKNRIEEKARP